MHDKFIVALGIYRNAMHDDHVMQVIMSYGTMVFSDFGPSTKSKPSARHFM
jgi:hypothetical protein